MAARGKAMLCLSGLFILDCRSKVSRCTHSAECVSIADTTASATGTVIDTTSLTSSKSSKACVSPLAGCISRTPIMVMPTRPANLFISFEQVKSLCFNAFAIISYPLCGMRIGRKRLPSFSRSTKMKASCSSRPRVMPSIISSI